MYFRLVNHYPAMSQANNLRSLLEERVRGENSSGASRSALLLELLGSEPMLTQAVQHEDFAAWEAHTARIGRDENFQAIALKMQPTMSRAQTQELHNVVFRETSNKAANYLWAPSFLPAPGKGPELTRLLEARARTAIGRGAATASLLTRLYGPADAATIMTAYTFPDLAALEAFQKGIQTMPEAPGFAAALQALAQPQGARLFRVLVPFPSQ